MIIWSALFLDFVMIGFVTGWSYVAWRGFVRNEFWQRGSFGWHVEKRFSGIWWFRTVCNLIFVACMIAASLIAFNRGDAVIWK